MWSRNFVRLSAPIDHSAWGTLLSPLAPWVVAADVDGDGCDDVIVSAIDCVIGDCFETAGAGQIYQRRAIVQVISGRTGSLIREWVDPEPPSNDAPPIDAPFGYRGGIAAADIDGDGFAEVAVAAPWRDVDLDNDGTKERRVGVVYVYEGSSGELIHTLHGNAPEARFGWTISFVGDWDRDGMSELMIAEWYATAPRRILIASGRTGEPLSAAVGEAVGLAGVVRIVNIGDVTGDGQADAMVSLHPSIYPGYKVVSSLAFDVPVAMPHYQNSESFRASRIGDLNGDGRDDIATMGYGGDGEESIFVISGASGELLRSISVGPSPPWGFYRVLASAGDPDGDGIPDIAFAPTVVSNGTGVPAEGVSVFSGLSGECIRQISTSMRANSDGDIDQELNLAHAFSSMVSGDFDGDGSLDIASVGVLENQPAPPYYLYQLNIFRRPGCPEDMTGDGFVGFADLSEFLDTFNDIDSPGALPADIDGNGQVDFSDLNLILAAFNSGC